jgi:hypothetical protein
MKEADVAFAELAKGPKKDGLKETEAGTTMKLNAGVFSNVLSRVYCGAGTLTGSIGGDFAAGADASIPNP